MQTTPVGPSAPALPPDLSGLGERLGDPALVADVVGVFLAMLPERLAVLADRSALAGDERVRAAHSLKSASALLGLTDLAAACEALESGLREVPQAPFAALVSRVGELARDAETQLRRVVPPS